MILKQIQKQKINGWINKNKKDNNNNNNKRKWFRMSNNKKKIMIMIMVIMNKIIICNKKSNIIKQTKTIKMNNKTKMINQKIYKYLYQVKIKKKSFYRKLIKKINEYYK